MTVEDAAENYVEAQLRIARELQRTGRCSRATKGRWRDAMLKILVAGLAEAAAEPEGPHRAAKCGRHPSVSRDRLSPL